MNVEGKQLPMIRHEQAHVLDVWRMDNGVAITLSSTTGTVYAGCQISLQQWHDIVECIDRQFKRSDT